MFRMSYDPPGSASWKEPVSQQPRKEDFQYAVVTLNYDDVLERCAEGLSLAGHEVAFHRSGYGSFDHGLAKLHGCVRTGSIVTPTCTKTFTDSVLLEERKLAFRLLRQAHRIRIVGYSLPEGDSYIKHLLRVAVLQGSGNLKSIDVVCFDPDGKVQERYDRFIQKETYRFRSMKTEEYLRDLVEVMEMRNGRAMCYYRPIEECHGGGGF